MKTIILIVLFAFAVQASVNTTAYHLGFTEQLGFNASELKDASACYASVQTVTQDFQSVVAAVKAQEVDQVVPGIIKLVADVQEEKNVECAGYRADLLKIFSHNGADLRTVAQQNFDAYPIQVIQQVATWVELLANGEQYEAGKTEAYILQILFGIEKPQAIAVPTFNVSDYVPFDAIKFYKEFNKVYLTSIGIDNQTNIDDITNCNIAYFNAYQAIQLLPYNFTNDLANNIEVVSQAVGVVSGAVDACITAFEVQKSYGKKFWKQLVAAPVANLFHIAFNLALNLPEIAEQSATMDVDVFSGEYAQAGLVEAAMAKIIFDGVVNF